MRAWCLAIAVLLALAAAPTVAAAKTTVATNKVMVIRWWRGSTPKTTTKASGTAKVGAPKVTLPKAPSPKLPAPKVPAKPVVKPLPKTVTSGTTLKKAPTTVRRTRRVQPRTRRVVRGTPRGSSIAVLKSALGDPGIHRESEADLGSTTHVDGSREGAVEPLRHRPAPAPARVKGSIGRRRSTRVVVAVPPSQIKLLDHQMELLQMTEALQ